MRAIFSYGAALIIVLVLAVWLASGTLKIGGQGPGNGEKAIIGAAAGTAANPEQQALLDAAKAKQQAAENAKKAADQASRDATAALQVANQSDSSGAAKREELKKEVADKTKAAADAQKAADDATKAAKAADDAARAAQDAANTFKTIAERDSESSPGDASAEPRSVRIAVMEAQNQAITVDLRGRTRAKSTVSVVAQTAGTVQSISVTKGQSVKAGDLLCTLDQGARKLAVQQAQAAVDQAQTAADSNATLVQKGLAAQNTALAAQSALAGAKTALENAQLELSRTEIKADVGGVVQDPLATVGSMLAAGQPCATLVQLDPIVFIASVPEAKMAYARVGLDATVTTVSGATAKGRVTYIAPTADDATRSFPVEIEIPNPDGKLLNGITADATVTVGIAPVTILPQSVLTLDDNGVLGIRTVEDGNKVAFHEINVLKDTRDGVWVLGLPSKINVITVGQEYVQPGQIVDAKTDDMKTAAGGQPS
jgi:multidrug efflux system membrane fusion protein